MLYGDQKTNSEAMPYPCEISKTINSSFVHRVVFTSSLTYPVYILGCALRVPVYRVILVVKFNLALICCLKIWYGILM